MSNFRPTLHTLRELEIFTNYAETMHRFYLFIGLHSRADRWEKEFRPWIETEFHRLSTTSS